MSKILYTCDTGPEGKGPDLMFFCPGCKCGHGVWTRPNVQPGPWTFNGNMECPTFEPSILVTRKTWVPPVTPENLEEFKRNPWPQKQVDFVCHSFVRDGKIQFLSDCTHELAGQTVPLPEF